ncbi:MAG: dihydropteroate synthase [Candidatus Tyrphobacter sp.]
MADRGGWTVGATPLVWGARTYVMGIVNVTPDSFSGDGCTTVHEALAVAERHVREGADILDVGGESTRPGHLPLDAESELLRAIPVVQALRDRFPAMPISIDTSKAVVARAAAESGANAINCVRRAPDDLLEIAAERKLAFIAMHNAASPEYGDDVVDAVARVLQECADRGVRRGIPRQLMLVDPGIGFAKTAEQNLRILQRLDRIVALGFPTVLGTSRKSTLGLLTGRQPQARVAATAATSALAATAGIDVVRVHDVAETRDAVRVADAIARGWRPHAWTA